MARSLAAALLLTASAAHAQEAAPADPLASLSSIEAHACITGGVVELILIQRGDDGPAGLGTWEGAQVHETGSLLTIIHNLAVLQIGDDSSALMVDGVAQEIICIPATDQLRTAILTMTGGSATFAIALEAGNAAGARLVNAEAEARRLRALLDTAQRQLSAEQARSAESGRRTGELSTEAANLRAQLETAEESLAAAVRREVSLRDILADAGIAAPTIALDVLLDPETLDRDAVVAAIASAQMEPRLRAQLLRSLDLAVNRPALLPDVLAHIRAVLVASGAAE